MWKRAHSSGDLTAEVQRSQEQKHSSVTDAVRSIFNTTRCYDLMQTSCKVIVFDKDIPFQLAFYALAEQDADIAPIWDPRTKRFVAMMTSQDFLQALWLYSHSTSKSQDDLKYKSIGQMLDEAEATSVFKHNQFQTIDAEDSAYQMCRLLQRQGTDFVPVTDPDEGNLVAVLGYLDIVNLLDTAARQFPHLFEATIQDANIGTYRVVTCPETTRLAEALQICQQKRISSIPVVNEANQVVGLYYKSDVSFITKNPNPDVILATIDEVTVKDVIMAAPPLLVLNNPSGAMADRPPVPPVTSTGAPGTEMGTNETKFRSCLQTEHIREVLTTMMDSRVTRVVVVDTNQQCLGIVSIKDIVMFFLNS